MPTYKVIEKSTGIEKYRYSNATPIPWTGMGFDDYDHILVPDEEPPAQPPAPVYIWTKLEYLRRFTPEERIGIRAAATVNPALADYMELLNLAEEIRSNDPDIINATNMLEANGLIAVGRAAEILGSV